MSFAYLPLFTGDYLRDTRHLTPLRHGVYLLALMHCWDSKGPMPLDEQECAGICNCRSGDEVDAMRYVLAKYFTRMEDGHYNHRMQAEVEKSSVLSLARSEAGRKGYEAKARHLPSKRQAIGKQEPLSPSPSPSPSPSLLKETSNLTVAAARPTAKAALECPHLEILALWAEALPAMPRHLASQWKGARADHLRARWKETAVEKGWKDQAQGLAYFRKLFDYIGQSRFLTGRAAVGAGRRPFTVELEWLVSPTNWAKTIEGKYHGETA